MATLLLLMIVLEGTWCIQLRWLVNVDKYHYFGGHPTHTNCVGRRQEEASHFFACRAGVPEAEVVAIL